MNKKKIILIASIVAVIVAIAITCIIIISSGNKQDGNMSKVSKLLNKLEKNQNFSFSSYLDEQNNMKYARKKDKAYRNTIYQGRESKFIVANGNSYLLVDSDKEYYTYANNVSDLTRVTGEFKGLQEKEYVTGKEIIDNKEFDYEEYEELTSFLVKDPDEINQETAKTRFYFKGNKLEYIKTIAEGYEELLKVEISYSANSKLFEIPKDYKEM